MSADLRAAAARLVLAAWDAMNVPYCILNGLNDQGEMGRDIDFLVPRARIADFLQAAKVALENAGFTVRFPPAIWADRLIAGRGGWDSMIEFHALADVRWRHVIFARKIEPVVRTSGFAENRWASFAKQVLLPLIAEGAHVMPKVSAAFRDFAPEREDFANRCATLFGRRSAAQLFAALQAGDRAQLDQPGLRRAASRRAVLRSPFRSALLLLQRSFRRVAAPFFPCTPVVALVGPDGVGKSSVLRLLVEGGRSIFTKITVRHWRPGLLPNLGGKSRAGAGGGPPRRKAGRFPWLRVFYYFWDYFLGDWLLDRPARSRQNLILYDRCALDMGVDPLRYGLSSSRPVSWLWRFIPKPGLIILLDGDPAVIHARKPELTIPEITAQLEAWRALRARGEIHAAIDTAAPAEEVAARIRELITAAFLQMHETKPEAAR